MSIGTAIILTEAKGTKLTIEYRDLSQILNYKNQKIVFATHTQHEMAEENLKKRKKSEESAKSEKLTT